MAVRTESACEAELEGLTALRDDGPVPSVELLLWILVFFSLPYARVFCMVCVIGCLEFSAVVPTRPPHNNTYTFPIIEVGHEGMEADVYIGVRMNYALGTVSQL